MPNIQAYITDLENRETNGKWPTNECIKNYIKMEHFRCSGSPFYSATRLYYIIYNCLWNSKFDSSFLFFSPTFKIHSLILRLKVCPENERGSGNAAGHTRGGTIRQQERSSAITPASVTAAGNSVTPSPRVPVGPPPLGRARMLPSSNRSALLHIFPIQMFLMGLTELFGSCSMAALWLKLALGHTPLVPPRPAVAAGNCLKHLLPLVPQSPTRPPTRRLSRVA